MRQRIAIIGGGIAGLTSAYLLNKHYDITLYEKADRIGGNAYTYTTRDGDRADIGVMSFVKPVYKNFFKLLDRLNIKTTLYTGLAGCFVNMDSGESVNFAPRPAAMLAQGFGMFKPGLIKSAICMQNGLRTAGRLFDNNEVDGLTLEEGLKKVPEIYGDGKLLYLGTLCMMSSMHCDGVLAAPAAYFFEKAKKYEKIYPPKVLFYVRFMKNQTRSYLDALSAGFRDRIVLNARIRAIARSAKDVTLCMEDGQKSVYDKVVLACNADQALRLLDKATDRENNLLGAWTYTTSNMIVHSDHSLFPKKELISGYTFLYRPAGRYIQTSVSFSLWILPGVSKRSNLMITQHCNFPIKEEKIEFQRDFRTPNYDFRSYAAIKELPSLNGANNTYYCGSHFGFGLHEDAVTSAMNVARQLGGDVI